MASEAKVSEVISVFKCKKDPDIENFLKNKAILYEKKAKSRTYLIFDEEAMLLGEIKLLAYFAIAIQTLKIPEGISPSQIRKLDGFYSRKGALLQKYQHKLKSMYIFPLKSSKKFHRGPGVVVISNALRPAADTCRWLTAGQHPQQKISIITFRYPLFQ